MNSPSARLRSRLRLFAWLFHVSLASWVLLANGCESATCADGFVELDGTCAEPACDSPCGDNEYCDLDVTPAACVCSPGFSGSPCAFSGLIEDPGFTQPIGTGPWEGTLGATVLNRSPGDLDIGEGALFPNVVCNAGRLLQVVEMPSLENSLPLVAEIQYRAQGVHGLALGFDGAWTRIAPTDDAWTPARVCLGEGAYGPAPGGGPITVQLSASERLADCVDGGEPEGEIRIDRFNIVPADEGECPSRGGALNAAAEPDGQPWRFLVEGDVDWGLVEGVGLNESGGARLSREADATGRATMATLVSVPRGTTLQSPALRFWWRGTDRQVFDIKAGTLVSLDDRGRQLDTLVGNIITDFPDTSGSPILYCLPSWTQGTVLELSFSLPQESTPKAVELVIDEVSVTTDPACAGGDALFDPGFESAPNPWFGASLSSADEAVVMQPEATLARNGDGVLELTYWTDAPATSMETYVRIPTDEPSPALTFYSRSPTTPSVEVQWFLGRSEFVFGPIRTTDVWQQNQVCLPSEWAGRWFRVTVRTESGPGPGAPIAQERVYLDDFALGSCSAERSITY